VISDQKRKKAKSDHESLVTDHFLGLPHRPPFVFVKKLIARALGASAECETDFSSADPMFGGHFSRRSAGSGRDLSQSVGPNCRDWGASTKHGAAFFVVRNSVDEIFRPVRPGEKIILRAQKIGEVDRLLQFEVEAQVNAETVAAGQLVLSAS